MGDSAKRGPENKIRRLINEYDLHGLGAELEQKWTAEHDRWSLRDLADYVNHRLLEETLSEVGKSPLDGEIENTYRLLTDDAASCADRTRIRRRLERQEIDVDQLERDFVSYQAIRTYLKKYREAEYSAPDTNPLEEAATTINQLRSRLVTVSESKLHRLSEKESIEMESPTITVNLRVTCDQCGTQLSPEELFSGENCTCDSMNEPNP